MGKIVDSLINDLVVYSSTVINSPDFSNAYILLKGEVPAGTSRCRGQKIGPVLLTVTSSLSSSISFLLAMIIFLDGESDQQDEKERKVAPRQLRHRNIAC